MARHGFVYGFVFGVAALVLAACSDAPDATGPEPPLPDPTCEGFYGAPNESTGLSGDVCFPRIEGEETWEPRAWDEASLAELRSWVLENPPGILTEDPYLATPGLRPDESAACAVIVTGERTYRLETFPSAGAAERAGGIVTHGIGCGACSALTDLAAYVETPDQTAPVRQCTIDNLGRTVEDLAACIRAAVGFSPPCARIWAYNALNDSRECLDVCLAELDSPYNRQDGSLNPCLQCDEDVSGPVFKALAGRTRRSSGLPAAICRPCELVWRVNRRAG